MIGGRALKRGLQQPCGQPNLHEDQQNAQEKSTLVCRARVVLTRHKVENLLCRAHRAPPITNGTLSVANPKHSGLFVNCSRLKLRAGRTYFYFSDESFKLKAKVGCMSSSQRFVFF